MAAATLEKEMEKSNFVIFTPEYRPQLFWSIMIPCFQQWTGINAIIFYSAPLFKTLGFGQSTALLNAVIMGVVNMLATIVSIVLADRVGRIVLFIQGGFQMLACQVRSGIVLIIHVFSHPFVLSLLNESDVYLSRLAVTC